MKKKLLTPAECCLHIIDPQQSLMTHIHQAEQVVKVITFMLAGARILSIPVIANTQYKKGLGAYVPELEALMEGIPRPDKTEFGALNNVETRALIDRLPATVNTMIMVGVETHICVYQTAIGALERGIVPWIVSDGTSARNVQHHELALAALRAAGAMIGPAEMIIYELLGRAGTPQFKEILPFIVNLNK